MLSILLFVLIVVGFIYFVNLCVFVLGGNVYDVTHFKKIRQQKRDNLDYNPLVSVIIPAFNEEKVIRRCINSVLASTYTNIEIIVVDDGSSDKTNEIVRRYNNLLGDTVLRAVRRTKNQGKANQLTYVLRNYANGEIIMTLDADSVLEQRAIERGVRHFTDKNVQGIAANVRIIEDPSLLNLLQIFEYIVSYRTKKFYTLVNSEFIIGGVGSMYRMSLIKSFGFYDDLSATEDIALSMKIASHGSNRYKLMYAMDVVCYTESVQSISGLLKQRYRWKYGSLQSLFRFTKGFIVNKKYQSASMLFYRLPMAYFSELLLVLEPFLVTLAIYLSIISGTITLFFSAYMMLSIYLLIVLWSDELLTVRSKTTLSVFVPIIYFLFYIMSFIQIVAAFKSVAKLPELFKEQHSNTWISPVRSGRATVKL